MIGLNHGHPLDLPQGHLQDGWSYYRFNNLFGPWRSAGGEQTLADIRAQTGNPSIVVLLHRNLPDGDRVYDTFITNGDTQVLRYYAGIALNWLKERGLQNSVIVDILNGPERPFRTSYTGFADKGEASRLPERFYNEMVKRVQDAGFSVVQRQMRHLYIHRTNASPRDFWLDSRTDTTVAGKYWVTECGVHESLGSERAATFSFLLNTALWDAERIYVHAPYQQGDGAGYGGVWYDPAIRAIIQAKM